MKIKVSDKLGRDNDFFHDISASGNPDNVLKIVREELRDDVSSNFEFEHDPYGKRWQPNSKETRQWKGKDKKILEDSGDLSQEMSSLDNYIIEGTKLYAVTTVTAMDEDGLGYIFYGDDHDKGYNKMPKREFVAYTDKIHKKVDKRVNDLFK